MSPALEKERIDHQILNPIFSGTEPDRDTLAEYQIHLAAFFCISVPECLGRCVGKHPEKLWVKIPNYFCLSAYVNQLLAFEDRTRRPLCRYPLFIRNEKIPIIHGYRYLMHVDKS